MCPQLPIELFDDIFQYLQPTDLVALSTTNSLIYPVVQRLLYRNVSVSLPSHNLGVVLTLANKPEFAQHVRTFAIRLYPLSTVFKSFYRHLAKALSSMTELTSLDVFVDPSASWVLPGAHSPSLPRLSHFACSFALDSHVVAFLSKTDALLELRIDATSATPTLPIPVLPVTSLPRLSQFVGSSHAANMIVPGRPIESIHLNSGDLTESDVVNLSKSSAHVVILGATTSSLPVPLLGSLTHCMPHLSYLRIMTTHTEPPDDTLESIATALASFSNLKAFELSGMHWGSSQKNRDERIWHLQPFTSEFVAANADDVVLDTDADIFFLY